MAKKKKKKEPKVEKVFDSKTEERAEVANVEDQLAAEGSSNIDDFLGVEEETPKDNLTEKQRAKLEKLNNVKNKISKILQSSNIEIVDENFDDDYESGSGAVSDEQAQQDYDSLKAMFGGKDKNKNSEVTLTIDDFDYSYIGQYLEEYDLMHMKNIKRVKIQRKKNPKLKKFLIAASVVLAIAGGAVAAFFVTRKTPVVLESVVLNQTSRSYYTNEEFDETGLYFIAQYSDGSTKKVKLEQTHFNSELSTGKFERIGEEKKEIIFVNNGTANLVFSYQGFNVNYEVTVKKKTEVGMKVIYSKDGIFNIQPGGLITEDLLRIFIKYEGIGDGYLKYSKSSNVTIFVDGAKCNQTEDGYVVENGTTSASQIVVRYLSYEIVLDSSTEILDV
jgi:hypothetical protein